MFEFNVIQQTQEVCKTLSTRVTQRCIGSRVFTTKEVYKQLLSQNITTIIIYMSCKCFFSEDSSERYTITVSLVCNGLECTLYSFINGPLTKKYERAIVGGGDHFGDKT